MEKKETLYDLAKASNIRLKRRVKECTKLTTIEINKLRKKTIKDISVYTIVIFLGCLIMKSNIDLGQIINEGLIIKNSTITDKLINLFGITIIGSGLIGGLAKIVKNKERRQEIKKLKKQREEIKKIYLSQRYSDEELEEYKKFETGYILKRTNR